MSSDCMVPILFIKKISISAVKLCRRPDILGHKSFYICPVKYLYHVIIDNKSIYY